MFVEALGFYLCPAARCCLNGVVGLQYAFFTIGQRRNTPMRRLLILLVGFGVLINMSCSHVEGPGDLSPVVKNEGDRIFIVDQTGKEWDITHAVRNYAFSPTEFQFGLGPRAIRPILNPQFATAGHPSYPADDFDGVVIGTEIGGDSRAYRLSDLNAHEVVDDKFGDLHVAVGW